ncbi:MAG: GDP-mannose 4,6-dehydratase [Myxococcota bacterium]
MRVFVTGAAGFVGRRLVPRLVEAGAHVETADRELDVSDAALVERAFAATEPDAIVHLAAVSSVPEAEANRALAFRVNFLGTRAVLAGALGVAPRARVLLVSSCTVYGSAAPGSPPFDESAPLDPRDAYARTKAASDLLGAAYAARGLDVVRARPWNHTGAGRPDRFVESSLARQITAIEAGRSEPRIAVGNLESVRDFLHVDDVVDAYLALLEPTVPAGVYNVASGDGLSIRGLLDRLLARSSARPEIVVDPARVRPADLTVGTAEKLRAATGWQPRRGAARAFDELLAYWREQIAAQP